MSIKKKIEIEDIDINMNVVAKEIVMGPKSRLVKKLDKLNSSYVTSDYVYGNRSLLVPLKPLGVTRTYRWKAGYQDTIKKVLLNRFYQYDKKSGNLRTLLVSRPERMEWTRQRFVTSLTDIELEMKELRRRKITMEDTATKAVDFYNQVISKIKDKNFEARNFFNSYPDLDYDLYITGYDEAAISAKRSIIEDSGIDKYNDIKEIIKFETSSLVMDIHLKKPEIIVKNKEDRTITEVGRIPLDPTSLSFAMPLRNIINALYTNDLGDLKLKDIKDNDQHSSYHLSLCNLTYPEHLECIGRFDGIDKGVRHPFISAHNDRYNDGFRFQKWYEDTEDEGLNHVCFGNMQDEIEEAFANLDFMGLMMLLTKWQTYVVGATSPLNNISMSLLTIPEDQYSETFAKTAALQPKAIQQRILEQFGASKVMTTGSGNNHPSSAFIWDKESDWGTKSWNNQAIQWYQEKVNIKYISEMHFGWDFFIPNWIPHRHAMNKIINSEQYRIDDHLDPRLFTDYDWQNDSEYDAEPEEYLQRIEAARWEFIRFYQENQIATAQAFVDFLDENKCRTRTCSLYQYINTFLSKLYDPSLIDAKEEKKEMLTTTIPDRIVSPDLSVEEYESNRNYNSTIDALVEEEEYNLYGSLRQQNESEETEQTIMDMMSAAMIQQRQRSQNE